MSHSRHNNPYFALNWKLFICEQTNRSIKCRAWQTASEHIINSLISAFLLCLWECDEVLGFSSARTVPKNLGGLFSKHVCHWREERAAVLSSLNLGVIYPSFALKPFRLQNFSGMLLFLPTYSVHSGDAERNHWRSALMRYLVKIVFLPYLSGSESHKSRFMGENLQPFSSTKTILWNTRREQLLNRL